MVKTLKQHIITTALKDAFQREAHSPIPLPLSAASSSPFAPPCQWPGVIVTTGCSQEPSEAVQHVPGSPAGGVSLGCFMGERVSLMAETLAGSHGPRGSWDKVCTSCLCDVAGQVPRPLTVMCLCGQPALTISSSESTTTTPLMILLLLDGELHEIGDNISSITVCMTPGIDSNTDEALGISSSSSSFFTSS